MAKTKSNEIPYSKEAEVYVLGSILLEPDLANEFCGSLSVDDFYHGPHKKVYQAIEHNYKSKKETNVINVIETLKMFGYYEDIKEQYLFELADAIPTTITTVSYVEILKDRSLERELYYKTKEIQTKVLEGETEISDLLAFAERGIGDIVNSQRTGNLLRVSHSVDKVFTMIEANRKKSVDSVIGVDTGYKELNDYTSGFQNGELIILAARPSVGKSALALNIGYKVSKQNKYVAFFSLEMGIDQLVLRLLSSSSNVLLSNIKTGKLSEEETSRVLNARIELDDLNFYIDETANNSFEDIKVKCRKLKRERKLDLIIIDYLQLLSLSKGKSKLSRYEEVSGLSRSLKLLALELDIPIVALSQLSRSVAIRNNSKEAGSVASPPVLSDLRESGSIEQDADIVLFLHRDKETDDPTKRASTHKVKLIVAKNRQGTTGAFDLLFRAECSSFENLKKKGN